MLIMLKKDGRQVQIPTSKIRRFGEIEPEERRRICEEIKRRLLHDDCYPGREKH
jgi:hypothetical protein